MIKLESTPELSVASTASLFNAASDPTRLRLLSMLAHNGETCVCDLVDATGLNQTTVSRHLGTLRHAGLVVGRREGLWVHYSLIKPTNEVHKQVLTAIKRAADLSPELQKDLQSLKATCCEPNSPVQIRVK